MPLQARRRGGDATEAPTIADGTDTAAGRDPAAGPEAAVGEAPIFGEGAGAGFTFLWAAQHVGQRHSTPRVPSARMRRVRRHPCVALISVYVELVSGALAAQSIHVGLSAMSWSGSRRYGPPRQQRPGNKHTTHPRDLPR